MKLKAETFQLYYLVKFVYSCLNKMENRRTIKSNDVSFVDVMNSDVSTSCNFHKSDFHEAFMIFVGKFYSQVALKFVCILKTLCSRLESSCFSPPQF